MYSSRCIVYEEAVIQRVPRVRMAAASHQTWQAVASGSGGEGESNRPCREGFRRVVCRGPDSVCAELMGATARRPDSVCSLTKETWTYGRAVFRDNRRAQGGAYVCYKLSQVQPSCASWSHSCSTCARGLSRVQSDLSNLSRTALHTLGVRASMSTPNSEVASKEAAQSGTIQNTTDDQISHDPRLAVARNTTPGSSSPHSHTDRRI